MAAHEPDLTEPERNDAIVKLYQDIAAIAIATSKLGPNDRPTMLEIGEALEIASDRMKLLADDVLTAEQEAERDATRDIARSVS